MNNLKAALTYCKNYNFSILPCMGRKDKGKVPFGAAEGWIKYQTVKPDEALLTHWFEGDYKGFNIGLVTGEISGVVMLDVDPGADLTGLHLPPTAISESKPDSFHYYFKHPGFKVTNSVGDIGPKLDFRGDGGFGVLPPSQHFNKITGAPDYPYQWVVPPKEIGFADMPQWLIDKTKDSNLAPLDWDKLIGLEEGKRDTNLYRVACSLLSRGVPSKLVYLFLVWLGQQFNPPFKESVVRRKFESAVKFILKDWEGVENGF